MINRLRIDSQDVGEHKLHVESKITRPLSYFFLINFLLENQLTQNQ